MKKVSLFLTAVGFLNPDFSQENKFSEYVDILDKYELIEDENMFLDLIDHYIFDSEENINQ